MSNPYFSDPPIEIETGPNPQFSIIWMHGLGADGNDFVPIVPEFHLPQSPAVRFVFPHAPHMAVTCNNGYMMRAWFDILSMAGGSRDVNADTVIASVAGVQSLIEQEKMRGIPASHILLAGFSQGAAMAYTVGLTHPERLGGLIALSGYIPTPDWVRENANPANRSTPIFAAHGSMDDVLPIRLGVAARDLARELNDSVEWHEWPMPHTLCMEEVEAISGWLQSRLACCN